MKFWAGERKKNAKFWAPHPSGPHFFWVRAPHPFGPPPSLCVGLLVELVVFVKTGTQQTAPPPSPRGCSCCCCLCCCSCHCVCVVVVVVVVVCVVVLWLLFCVCCCCVLLLCGCFVVVDCAPPKMSPLNVPLFWAAASNSPSCPGVDHCDSITDHSTTPFP